VLEIFGKDIGKNILYLSTYSDGDEPKVLAAIKEAKLSCKLDANGFPCYKSFNNYVIYKSLKWPRHGLVSVGKKRVKNLLPFLKSWQKWNPNRCR
jgi:hypothetical protein